MADDRDDIQQRWVARPGALTWSIIVDQFFNDSTGEGDDGEKDMRGPWNEGGDWEFVQSPALTSLRDAKTGERETDAPTLPDADGPQGSAPARSKPAQSKKKRK